MLRHRFLTAIAGLLALLAAAPLASQALPLQNPFAAKPSKEHELLARFVGRWNAKFTLLMPGAPPLDSHATEVGETLDGLWLVSRYEDPNMLGGKFSGVQLLGYDPAKKKYVAVWADNQTASLSLQEGDWDETTKTLTLIGESLDPLSGKPSTSKSVVRFVDADHRSSSMLVPGPGGKELEMFHIDYERAK